MIYRPQCCPVARNGNDWQKVGSRSIKGSFHELRAEALLDFVLSFDLAQRFRSQFLYHHWGFYQRRHLARSFWSAIRQTDPAVYIDPAPSGRAGPPASDS